MTRKHRRGQRGRGGEPLFLMTLECDGNAVNEEGWDKTLRFPHTGRQIWEEPGEVLGSAVLDAAAAERGAAELCRPQECGMNRV